MNSPTFQLNCPDFRPNFLLIFPNDVSFSFNEELFSNYSPRFKSLISNLPRSQTHFTITDMNFEAIPDRSLIPILNDLFSMRMIQINEYNAAKLNIFAKYWQIHELETVTSEYLSRQSNNMILEEVVSLRKEIAELRSLILSRPDAFNTNLNTSNYIQENIPQSNQQIHINNNNNNISQSENAKTTTNNNNINNNEERNKVEITENNEKEAIFSKLWKESNGNPAESGLLVISGPNYNDVHAQNLPSIIDPKWDGFWTSRRMENPYIAFDFCGKILTPYKYKLKTFNADANLGHLKSWTIFGLIGQDWLILDQQNDRDELNGESKEAIFEIQNPQPCSELKIVMTDKNWAGKRQFFLTGIEIYGDLV